MKWLLASKCLWQKLIDRHLDSEYGLRCDGKPAARVHHKARQASSPSPARPTHRPATPHKSVRARARSSSQQSHHKKKGKKHAVRAQETETVMVDDADDVDDVDSSVHSAMDSSVQSEPDKRKRQRPVGADDEPGYSSAGSFASSVSAPVRRTPSPSSFLRTCRPHRAGGPCLPGRVCH